MKDMESNSQLMAQLLDEFGGPTILDRGMLIDGIVVARQGNLDYLVDCGGKSEGVLPASEAGEQELSIGSPVRVLITQPPLDDEPARLSIRHAQSWQSMIDAKQNGQTVKIFLTRAAAARGGHSSGFHATCGNIHGFVPGMKLGFNPTKARDIAKRGEALEAKVLEADPAINRLVFDCAAVRREKAEQARLSEELRDRRFDSLNRGDEVNGTVVSVTDYGCFVDVGDGLHGLLHNDEHDGDKLSVGQTVSARVTRCERNDEGVRRLALSTQKPFMERIKSGDTITGVVRNKAAFGAFIRLSRGERIDGLVHKSEMPNGEETLSELKPGDNIVVRVIDVDRVRGRIDLSMRNIA